MQKTLMLCAAVALSGCAAGNLSPSVEAENVAPIVKSARIALQSCLDDGINSSCERFKELAKKHTWIIDGKMSTTNLNGMRQEEWDAQVGEIKSNMQWMRNAFSHRQDEITKKL